MREREGGKTRLRVTLSHVITRSSGLVKTGEFYIPHEGNLHIHIRTYMHIFPIIRSYYNEETSTKSKVYFTEP